MLLVRVFAVMWTCYGISSNALADNLKIAFWIDSVQKSISNDIANAIKDTQTIQPNIQIKDYLLTISSFGKDDSDADSSVGLQELCELLSSEGISVIVDTTYELWEEGMELITKQGIPYVKVDPLTTPFLEMFASFIQQKEGNDVVLLFESEQTQTEALFHIVEGYPFRTLLLNAIDGINFTQRLQNLRPSPSYYAIFARATNMNTIFEKILKSQLFARPHEWHFVFLDPRERLFKFKKNVEFATKFALNSKTLCKSLEMKESYCSSGFTMQRALLFSVIRALIEIKQKNPDWLLPIKTNCENDNKAETETFNLLEHLRFTDFLTLNTVNSNNEDSMTVPTLKYLINVTISTYSNEHEAVTDLAAWKAEQLHLINETISKAKRFFRISITEAVPWTYQRRNPENNELMFDGKGNPIWEGFCIDMIVAMSQRLNFDYELVVPKTGKYGERDPKTGRWDGIVGDLVSGETDFAVAALKMYSEREEVIDFIAPYYEMTGISIVIRRPLRKTSLFKFMTVLRCEVWLSIIAALVATAIMIWLLDRYSPYSSKNNPQAYPYPCREFTLRESFWFALTSFTPQGGGEAPKAVSGRVLVAAYWLFVVLMLATFTANLAAFLTVERMQTPVQSLEQLARQSRINYTVVADSDTHQYFINMKFAEDTLYRMWKELALNASPNYHNFRVWDYPIKEQYGHILLSINASNPVANASEGFRLVNEHENADFAFIHDSAEIKYEIIRNCNLTEVGEVFAEQPYAIAVQQGSHLVDEFSFALLELQKDRFLEDLKGKYWNHSLAKQCLRSDDQGGITLESLGGVFIATLFGLAFAMLTLLGEVFYYKRIEKKTKRQQTPQITKVAPIEDQVESKRKRNDVWHTGNDSIDRIVKKITPPPSFETATFRSRRKDQTVTLGGDEFRPRRVATQRKTEKHIYSERSTKNSNYPSYME